MIFKTTGPSVYLFIRLADSNEAREAIATAALFAYFEDVGVTPQIVRQDSPAVDSCIRKQWWGLHIDQHALPLLVQTWWEGTAHVLELATPQHSLRLLGLHVETPFIHLMIGAARAVNARVAVEAGIFGVGPYVAGALLDLWTSDARPDHNTPGTLWPNEHGELDWIPLESAIDLGYLADSPGIDGSAAS